MKAEGKNSSTEKPSPLLVLLVHLPTMEFLTPTELSGPPKREMIIPSIYRYTNPRTTGPSTALSRYDDMMTRLHIHLIHLYVILDPLTPALRPL